MTSFLDSINYSSCNEDAMSECRALRIGPSDSLLCVTGSGARTLDLLTQRPRCIVSVDINRRQSDLLHLKLAAIRRFSYDEFLVFLGVTASGQRLKMYDEIRGQLPKTARRYWDGCAGTLERGVIYAGRWERYFGRLGGFVGLVWADRRRRLFACRDVDEQVRLWESEWRGAPFRSFLRVATARTLWRHGLRDPGFYEHVPRDADVAGYLTDCFSRAAGSYLFSESAFAKLLFFGRYDPNGPLPLHLQCDHYNALKAGVDRVHVETSPLGSLLGATSERFSAYSLSDIASYTSQREYTDLWAGIQRRALPGARFCERQFLVKRALPVWIPERDALLEAQLRSSDRSIFYSFAVGRVRAKAGRPSQIAVRR